jgi:hypothetical protein
MFAGDCPAAVTICLARRKIGSVSCSDPRSIVFPDFRAVAQGLLGNSASFAADAISSSHFPPPAEG